MKIKLMTSALSLCLLSSLSSADYKIMYKKDNMDIPEPSGLVATDDVENLNPLAWYTSENVELDDSDIVLKMEDVTGNGYDANKFVGDITIIDNELNGYPALRSEESTLYANIDTRNFSAMTVFSVLKGNGSSRMLGFSNYDSSPRGGFKLFNDNVNGRPAGGAHYETNIYSGNDYVISTALVKDYSMSHYINGSFYSSLETDGVFYVSQSGAAIFGRPFVNSGAYSHVSDGYGIEMLVFDKELNEEELGVVHDYLKSKYSLN